MTHRSLGRPAFLLALLTAVSAAQPAPANDNFGMSPVIQQVGGHRCRRAVPCVPCPRPVPCVPGTQGTRPDSGQDTGMAPAPLPDDVVAPVPDDAKARTEAQSADSALDRDSTLPSTLDAAAMAPPDFPRSPRAERIAAGPQTFVPNMMGDTNAGGCGALTFQGAITAFVQHPTFACSRMNIAENNSPLLRDRVFVTYRHFHNASDMDIFKFAPLGGANSLNIDRYCLGFEKLLGERTSLEFRLPLNSQMSSDLTFRQLNNTSSLPLDDTSTDLGNIGLILKRELRKSRTFYLSGGLGVNIPTAPDVDLHGRVNAANFDVYDAHGNVIATLPNVAYSMDATVRNETVNLMPFLSAVWTPTDKFFTQGFFQIDVPVNESKASLSQSLTVDGTTEPVENGSNFIGQQTLMRLNLGVGRWLYRNERARGLKAVAFMFEVHYTSTLQDADVLHFDAIPAFGSIPETTCDIGNLRQRTDVVNMVAGVPIQIGKLTVYNGFGFPVSGGDNRGFDFEYSLLLDRRF